MTRFTLIGGQHRENGKTYNKGDEVVSSRELDKLFPTKFRSLGAVKPAPVAEKHTTAAVAAKTVVPAKPVAPVLEEEDEAPAPKQVRKPDPEEDEDEAPARVYTPPVKPVNKGRR